MLFSVSVVSYLRLALLLVALACGFGALCLIWLWPARLMRLLGVTLVRCAYQFRCVNATRLPAHGGVLLLPNHVTWADALFVSAACGRPVRFVMDEGMMRHAAVRWVVMLYGTVPIRRDQPREAIWSIVAALKAGDVVCLFPEGQLTRTGTLSTLQRGLQVIAAKAGHPLVPLWCDGVWGSRFSFGRGRFFGQWPDPIFRRKIITAFGEALEPAAATLPAVRHALLQTAAAAIAQRFQAPAWQTRLPRASQDGWQHFSPDARRRGWVNGYQIGQLHALPRRHCFSALACELATAAVPTAFHAFVELFKSPLVSRPETSLVGGSWVGGDRLRTLLETAAVAEPITFYDFSARALEPLTVPGVCHCPCLASAGMVVAMSMPDPVAAPNLKHPQRGGKPGTWGKLLPGWFTAPDAAAGLRLHGPAAPADGLPLPGCAVDDEGFVGPSA